MTFSDDTSLPQNCRGLRTTEVVHSRAVETGMKLVAHGGSVEWLADVVVLGRGVIQVTRKRAEDTSPRRKSHFVSHIVPAR